MAKAWLTAARAATAAGFAAVVFAAAISPGLLPTHFGAVSWPTGAVFLVLALASAWPDLAAVPSPVSARVVLALAGLAAVGLMTGAAKHPDWAVWVSVAFGFTLAAVRELVRRDGRGNLIRSVVGTASGVVMVCLAAFWAQGPLLFGGSTLAGGIGLAVAALVGFGLMAALNRPRFSWRELALAAAPIALAGMAGWVWTVLLG